MSGITSLRAQTAALLTEGNSLLGSSRRDSGEIQSLLARIAGVKAACGEERSREARPMQQDLGILQYRLVSLLPSVAGAPLYTGSFEVVNTLARLVDDLATGKGINLELFDKLPSEMQNKVYENLWRVRGCPVPESSIREKSAISHPEFGRVSFRDSEERCASTPDQKALALELCMTSSLIINAVKDLFLSGNEDQALILFAKLPSRVQNNVFRKLWEVMGSPMDRHMDFGRVAFLSEVRYDDVTPEKKAEALIAVLTDVSDQESVVSVIIEIAQESFAELERIPDANSRLSQIETQKQNRVHDVVEFLVGELEPRSSFVRSTRTSIEDIIGDYHTRYPALLCSRALLVLYPIPSIISTIPTLVAPIVVSAKSGGAAAAAAAAANTDFLGLDIDPSIYSPSRPSSTAPVAGAHGGAGDRGAAAAASAAARVVYPSVPAASAATPVWNEGGGGGGGGRVPPASRAPTVLATPPGGGAAAAAAAAAASATIEQVFSNNIDVIQHCPSGEKSVVADAMLAMWKVDSVLNGQARLLNPALGTYHMDRILWGLQEIIKELSALETTLGSTRQLGLAVRTKIESLKMVYNQALLRQITMTCENDERVLTEAPRELEMVILEQRIALHQSNLEYLCENHRDQEALIRDLNEHIRTLSGRLTSPSSLTKPIKEAIYAAYHQNREARELWLNPRLIDTLSTLPTYERDFLALQFSETYPVLGRPGFVTPSSLDQMRNAAMNAGTFATISNEGLRTICQGLSAELEGNITRCSNLVSQTMTSSILGTLENNRTMIRALLRDSKIDKKLKVAIIQKRIELCTSNYEVLTDRFKTTNPTVVEHAKRIMEEIQGDLRTFATPAPAAAGSTPSFLGTFLSAFRF